MKNKEIFLTQSSIAYDLINKYTYPFYVKKNKNFTNFQEDINNFQDNKNDNNNTKENNYSSNTYFKKRFQK